MNPHLSNSSVGMYQRCGKQYEFRYVQGRKIPPAGAQVQGRVGHSAAERNYRQKIASQQDLPVDELTDYFAETFEEEVKKEEPVLDEGQTVGALKDEGVMLVREHRKVLAPTVQPVSVEDRITLDFQLEDFKYDLMGVLDVVDAEGNIRDNKFVGRTPSAEDLSKDQQLSTYALLYRMREKKAENGLFIDAVVKNKTPVAKSLPAVRSREMLQSHLKDTIAPVAKGIQAGVFIANTGTFWCSKKMCGYHSICPAGKGQIIVDLGESNGPR